MLNDREKRYYYKKKIKEDIVIDLFAKLHKHINIILY